MMNNIFRTLIAEGIVVVYLDDILIFTEMEEEHEQVVQRVLEVLAEHKLFLCLEKCEFHRKRIEYLGLVILENKVEMDSIKVARVHNWPTPENQTDVQAFIGFVRVTGHKTPGESSVISQIVVMIQLTSRRILRD